MARRHALFVASILGLAAIIGVVALGNSLGLGTASTRAQDAVVARRSHQLDRFAASLRKQLAASKSAPVAQAAPVAAPTAATPQRVVYVRPAPIIVRKHRTGGEYEHEGADHEDEGGFDD